MPRLLSIAVCSLLGYAAWSYLSIGWSAQKGDAWDGANRTLLYALIFTLCALWRPRGRAAFGLVLAFCLGVSAVGLVELLRASSAADPASFFSQGRFASPAGYMNANVALWFSALFPCVTFGARRELHPALRGVLVGSAVLLCGLSVLGQSRGWLFTAPVALLLFIALVPQRVRTSLTLGLVLVATAVVSAPLLDVYRASEGRSGFGAAVSDASTALVLAAIVAGIVAMAAAFVDRRARPSRAQERRAGRALAITAAVVAVVGLVLFVAAYGSPFTVAKKGWHEFKTEPSPYGGESRFTGSLGTNRYDFWRVAWDRFAEKPLTGIGADNFQETYLANRHSDNAPKYPHSVEMRALSQTGLLGTLMLVVGLGAALTAAVLAIRRRRGLGAATAAAATASFSYWLIHGTIDWFWEFPALGGAAFALLGLAAGLLPRRLPSARDPRGRPSLLARAAAAPAVVLVLAIVPAAALAMPWFAEIQEQNAVAQWQDDAPGAFDKLDSAASLNPLSATPKLLAGSIALRLGRRAESEQYFREALERDPDDAYAHLELGALLADRGQRREAIVLLERAHQLDPRDDLTAGVLRRARAGRPVRIEAVNRQLADRSARLGR